MKKTLILLTLIATGCVNLQPPTSAQTTDSISKYKYAVIPDTGVVTSVAASNGNAVGKEFSPGNLIEGLLLKKGIFRISKSEPEFVDQLLIVKYGVSGKRDIPLMGYTQEVTINLIDAKSFTPVFTCSAEGIGATEVDDIRDAIIRCLEGLK